MSVSGPTGMHKRLIAVCAALLLILPGVNRADHSSSLAAEAVSTGMQEQVASIALYPDQVLSLVLAASTFPLQVDQAGGFLVQLKYDPDLNPDPTWDDSVVALLNYPDVVALMTADLDWTRRLGEAVRTRQSDVIDAVQRFRARAVRAGNLASDERQIVTDSAGLIEIAPANPSAIYVPRYDPGRVIYRSPTPVYHYYPTPFPNYAYAYPEDHPSGFTYFWGVTSTFSIDWHARRLSVFGRFHPDSPYLGHNHVPRHAYPSPLISFFHGRHLKGRSHHGHRRAHRRGARDGNRRADRRATNRPRRDARRPDRRGRSSANQRTTRGQEARPNRQTRRRAPVAKDSVNASSAQTTRSAKPARPNNRTRAARRSRRSNRAPRNRRATPASTQRSVAPAAETRSSTVQASGASASSASPTPRATRRQRRGRSRTRTKPQARAGTAVQSRATESSARSKPNQAKSTSQARRKAKARAAKRAKARRAKARRSARKTRGERS